MRNIFQNHDKHFLFVCFVGCFVLVFFFVAAVRSIQAQTHEKPIRHHILVSGPDGVSSKVQVYNDTGQLIRQFFTFGSNAGHGVKVLVDDIDGKTGEEIIAIPGEGREAELRIFDKKGNFLRKFTAFPGHTMGMNVEIFDLDDDGRKEIIATPLTARSQIRIFSHDGKLIKKFNAFPKEYNKGALITAGFCKSPHAKNATAKIIAAPVDGSGEIRVFSTRGHALYKFDAYGKKYTKGIRSLEASDLDKDGYMDIAVSQAYEGNEVRIFDCSGKKVAGFRPFSNYKSPVPVEFFVGNVDNHDPLEEIITLPARGAFAAVEVYDKNGTKKGEFGASATPGIILPLPKGEFRGTFGDFDGDGKTELVFGNARSQWPTIEIMDHDGGDYSNFGVFKKMFGTLVDVHVITAED